MSGDDTNYIIILVALHWFVSITMVYLNKVLMSSEGLSIPAPLFVTWFQCFITALICWGAGKMGEYMQHRADAAVLLPSKEPSDSDENKGHGTSFFAQFPKAEFRPAVAQRVFPLSFVFVGMITFNNLCLKWVEVSFYNVARAFTIVFNAALSYVMLGSTSSLRTILCLTIVVIGFFMGSQGELNFSWKGTISGIIGSLFVSLNSIYTKKVLPAVDNDHWKLTFYNNMIAILLFLPLLAYYEYAILLESMHLQFRSVVFWTAMMIAGLFGFGIGIITVLQIKATSPLSHNISGTAKAAIQSMLAFYIWGNQPTVMGVLGIFLVLGGSFLYAIVKMKESRSSSSSSNNKSPPPLKKLTIETPLVIKETELRTP